jgi:hypothetical protein
VKSKNNGMIAAVPVKNDDGITEYRWIGADVIISCGFLDIFSRTTSSPQPLHQITRIRSSSDE